MSRQKPDIAYCSLAHVEFGLRLVAVEKRQ
jgi:hypothetical protein